ncbi:MAG: DUF5606 domain-containing protein [Omnitrophica WOR_2 bacterium]
MNLKEIMAIAGKPGLFKMIAQAKNGIVVESIIDGKRLQAFTNDKISTLEEISIYTESDDMPLRQVLRTMYEKLEGKPAPENKGDNTRIKQFFGEVLPEYDKERVYVSHMQKIISWYNLLLDHDLKDMLTEEAATEEEPAQDTAVTEESAPETIKEKAAAKPVKKAVHTEETEPEVKEPKPAVKKTKAPGSAKKTKDTE